MDRRDVRVIQRREHLGRATEADHVVVARRPLAHDLDGDLAGQLTVRRPVDDRARADPQHLEEIVAAAEQVARAAHRVRGEDGLEPAPQVIRRRQAIGYVRRERGLQEPRQIVRGVTAGAHVADRPPARVLREELRAELVERRRQRVDVQARLGGAVPRLGRQVGRRADRVPE
jgi:hypothetical protein